MAMNIQSTLAAYGNYQSGYNSGKVKEKKETQNAQNVTKEALTSNGEKQLSKAAKEMLQKLRDSRTDMDFMVADFEKGDDAKELLSRSNKEFTVIFSTEELEKMASDEKYYEEKMQGIAGVVRMSEEINAQFGFERAFGKTQGEAAITKFGISFNSDGTTTFFAQLEKSSTQQKERIENIQQEKLEQRREEKKTESKSAEVKKTTVQAATQEELIEKIKNINWDLIKADNITVGGRLDLTI